MQRLSPSELMISPQSWATVNLCARTLPLRRSTSTSATIAPTAPERCAEAMPCPTNVSALRSGRRRARLPPGALGRGFDNGDVARRLQIAQAKGDRVRTGRGGDLVDKGFAGELDLRADRVAQMRGAVLST
jgi:hypothetical protein